MKPLTIRATTRDIDAPLLCTDTVATTDRDGKPVTVKGSAFACAGLVRAAQRFETDFRAAGFERAAGEAVAAVCAATGCAPPTKANPIVVELRMPDVDESLHLIVTAMPPRMPPPPVRREHAVLPGENISQTTNRLLRAGMSYALALSTASALHAEKSTATRPRVGT